MGSLSWGLRAPGLRFARAEAWAWSKLEPSTRDKQERNELAFPGFQIHAGMEQPHRRDRHQHPHAGDEHPGRHDRCRALRRADGDAQDAHRAGSCGAQLLCRVQGELRACDDPVGRLPACGRWTGLQLGRAADHAAAHPEDRGHDPVGHRVRMGVHTAGAVRQPTHAHDGERIHIFPRRLRSPQSTPSTSASSSTCGSNCRSCCSCSSCLATARCFRCMCRSKSTCCANTRGRRSRRMCRKTSGASRTTATTANDRLVRSQPRRPPLAVRH